MHPNLLSLIIFMFVLSFAPGPNNYLASYSAFNFGIKQSSAQITHYYNEENLKGKQVIAVCNFPEKNIAGVVSQVLILGSVDEEGKVTLVHPSQKADNGLPIA